VYNGLAGAEMILLNKPVLIVFCFLR